MAGDSSSLNEASPTPATIAMVLTYAVAGVGFYLGFSAVQEDPPTLSVATLLVVGGGGGLSFVRHALLHRSDAIRSGWDFGRRNNFQIEVGLANLAWALLGILAVCLDWGLVAESASLLVFGFYITSVAILLAPALEAKEPRSWFSTAATGTFGGAMIALGFMGMAAAGAGG